MRMVIVPAWPQIFLVVDGSLGETGYVLGLSRDCVVAFCKACGANAAITRLDQRWVSLGRSFTVCFPHSFQSKPVKVKVLVAKSCLTVTPWKPARLLCPWNFPAKNTRVGSYSLLQGIFSTQRSNLGLQTAGGFFTIWTTREALTLKQDVISSFIVYRLVCFASGNLFTKNTCGWLPGHIVQAIVLLGCIMATLWLSNQHREC